MEVSRKQVRSLIIRLRHEGERRYRAEHREDPPGSSPCVREAEPIIYCILIVSLIVYAILLARSRAEEPSLDQKATEEPQFCKIAATLGKTPLPSTAFSFCRFLPLWGREGEPCSL